MSKQVVKNIFHKKESCKKIKNKDMSRKRNLTKEKQSTCCPVCSTLPALVEDSPKQNNWFVFLTFWGKTIYVSNSIKLEVYVALQDRTWAEDSFGLSPSQITNNSPNFQWYWSHVVRNTVRSFGEIQLTIFDKYSRRRSNQDFFTDCILIVEFSKDSSRY